MNLEDYKGIWIFVEYTEDKISELTFELLGIGRRLADKLKVELSSVILGHNIKCDLNLLFHYGSDKIYKLDNKHLEVYRTIPFTDALEYLVNKYRPEVLILPATSIGKDLAPRLACRLETGLSADCTELDIGPDGNLIQKKPSYSENDYITILTPNHRPQMITIRSKIFTPQTPDPNRTGKIIEEHLELNESENWTKILEIIEEDQEDANIQEAEIIVSVGRGIKKPENLGLIKKLSSCINASIGASRSIVDLGWISHYHQVGLTGKTVKPKIYIACGISGAIHHIIGMKSSDFIIAINKDPEAPIFQIADIGIVGDLFEIIPILIDKLTIK
ncbi:MAG: electron transfer flavoprotein subunit alpha/FixB family protein [Candidatus Helarchaeota archaeon]